MMKKPLMIAGVAALFMPFAASAHNWPEQLTVTGEPGATTHSRLVSLQDLDLRRDRDVRVADGRIRTAVADVCGIGRMNGSLIAPHESGCYADAFDRARVALNSVVADQRQG